MNHYRLSPRAQRTLTSIVEWTIERFGVEQAVKYHDQIAARLSKLASGGMPHGRPCGAIVSKARPLAGLMCHREGRHYIVYRHVDEGILVVDFVHISRDFDAFFESLARMN